MAVGARRTMLAPPDALTSADLAGREVLGWLALFIEAHRLELPVEIGGQRGQRQAYIARAQAQHIAQQALGGGAAGRRPRFSRMRIDERMTRPAPSSWTAIIRPEA